MKYNKAIGAVIGAVAAVLVVFNIDIPPAIQGAVIAVASAIVTYLAPANA